jgi:ubiquinone/menaquinone biosynthesis C-methylase UbiE
MAMANDPRPGETVLELGFGPGWGLRTIAARTRGAKVFGVDQSARMVKQATRMNEVAVSRGRMVLVQGPFSPLPWIDEMFDKVLLVNAVYFFDAEGGISQRFIAHYDWAAVSSSMSLREKR